MADPDPRDDTSADHEQFEDKLLVPDHDAASVATADVYDATARNLVSDLFDADVVTSIPGDSVLVHKPSGIPFVSTKSEPSPHRRHRPIRRDKQ